MASKRSDEQFSNLTVKDNVIDTGSRTISIRNISIVGIEEIYPYRKIAIFLALAALVVAVAGMMEGSRRSPWSSGNDSDGYFIVATMMGFASIASFLVGRTFLAIVTNDGSYSLFFNQNIDFLKKVKSAIDERINHPESASQFTVNFNKGSIEQMSVDTMGGVSNMSAETVVSDSPGANVASHSAGAQVGIGNTMEVNTSYVNYETYLPHVEKIREAVPDRRPDLNIEHQLDELIDLMKQGSPTKEDKSRVEQLALNLAQVLQAYPPMVRLFSDIAGMVGRFL
jgi:hypothetical protein